MDSVVPPNAMHSNAERVTHSSHAENFLYLKGSNMLKLLMKLKRDERGISALEYAVLAGVLLVIIVAGVMTFGDQIEALFGNAAGSLSEVVGEVGESTDAGGDGG